jgi:hypothetical protein
MKLFIFLLLISTLLLGKSKESCYSVQLTSFVLKKNSAYDFEKQDYPKSCELLSFSNVNAVRCGCYEKYKDVKKEYADLSYFYPDAMIVTTYRYRFKNLALRSEIIKPVKVLESEIIPEAKAAVTEPIVSADNHAEEDVVEPSDEQSSFMEDVAIQGHIDLTTQAYLVLPQDKHPDNITLSGLFEAAYTKNDLTIKAQAKAQADTYDFKSQNEEHNNRTYLRLDELYAQYNLENDQILIGKYIRFWGALELRNITDVFNSNELRDDPDDSDKLGAWNLSYSHFTESGELSAMVKLYEQDREMATNPYVYYFFPSAVPIVNPATGLPITPPVPYVYDKKLQTESGEFRPSLYLKYSGSTETEYAVDYAFIYENGYDSQRYYSVTPATDLSHITTNENAYLVNKLLTYNTLVAGSTLFKLEATLTDVIDNAQIADYYQVGLGVEYTFSQVYGDADLGLISEYYNYGTLESGKRGDLELFEIFQNDLFLGLRYTFNNANDANIIGGAIIDTEYDEQVYYVKYESRLANSFKVNLDYKYIKPSPTDLTAFHLMGRHERLSLKLGYYF